MKVTVIMPVRDTRPDYLFESIYSILNQSDAVDHPILIIDDGSEMPSTLHALESLRINGRIHIERLEGKESDAHGGGRALNHALRIAETEYVAIMDSDDIAHRDRFKRQIDFLVKHPKCDALGTGIWGFYADDPFRKPLFTTIHPHMPNLSQQWFINHGTAIYRREKVLEVGGYDEKRRKAYDVDMWARLKLRAVIRNVEENLYAWRRYRK